MNYKIIVEPQAQKDIEDAYLYYKQKVNTKVAKQFFADINHAYKNLKVNPFYQIRTKGYRALPLKKFPYIIFFTLLEDSKEIMILALFNTHQNPEKYPN
jgi:toxin ParE1/3/4